MIFLEKNKKVDIRVTNPQLVPIIKNAKESGISYNDLLINWYNDANNKGLKDKIHDFEFWARTTSSNPSYPNIITMMGNFLGNVNFKCSESRCKAICRDLEELFIKHSKEALVEKDKLIVNTMSNVIEKNNKIKKKEVSNGEKKG